jgi:cobalt-zinc-cadmium efflux system outer membrane protein
MKYITILLLAGISIASFPPAAQSGEPMTRLPPTDSRASALPAATPAATNISVEVPLEHAQPVDWSTELPQPIQPREFESSTGDELDLGDLEALALSNNPTLRQASARVAAARATRVQVGLYPNPRVGYQGTEIGDEGQAGQQGFSVGQEFVLGRKLQLDRNAANQAVRQAEQDFAAQRMRVLNDVRMGYYETLVAQRRKEVTSQLLHIGEQGVETTQQLLNAQEVSQAELLQSRIELNSVRIVAANANNSYLSAWRRLATIVGTPATEPTWLRGDAEADLPELAWDESLEDLLNSSPEIAAALSGANQARWALRRARAEPVPNVDVQLVLQHDNATSDDIVGVQAVLPVPFFNRNQGGIARAQAQLILAEGEVGRVSLDLHQRLAAAFERYSNAKHQVEQYGKELLPDAKESLDLAADGYRQGEYTYLNLLTVQRTYFQTNLAYLDALQELWRSGVEIEGFLLTNSLAPVSR